MQTIEDSRRALSISSVERETGLTKDTLRVWERRYGFPLPLRDGNGDRVYPLAQVERLQLIRRLIDLGMRPGKLIAQTPGELAKLSERLAPGAALRAPPQSDIQRLMQAIRLHDVDQLKKALQLALLRQGLQRFVIDSIAPLNIAIGEAWICGELAIFEEHVYCEALQSVLREAIARESPSGGPPKLVLATVPDERHGLGLLMVEAVLAAEGVQCVSLGAQSPIAEIVRAALAHRAHVVGLSFSAAYATGRMIEALSDLRNALPESIKIWAGGTAVARVKRQIHNVKFMNSLEDLPKQASLWRGARAPQKA
jgi:MerR family transcriptional regulator, light-induced transcriptional regulator